MIVKAEFSSTLRSNTQKRLSNQFTREMWFLAELWGWLTMFQPLLWVSVIYDILQRGNCRRVVQLSCCKHNVVLTEKWPCTLLINKQANWTLIEIDENKKWFRIFFLVHEKFSSSYISFTYYSNVLSISCSHWCSSMMCKNIFCFFMISVQPLPQLFNKFYCCKLITRVQICF